MSNAHRQRPKYAGPAALLIVLALAAAITAQYSLDRSLQRGTTFNAPRRNLTMAAPVYRVNYATGNMAYDPASATGDPVYNRYRTPLGRQQLRTDPTVPMTTRSMARPTYNPQRALQRPRSSATVATAMSPLTPTRIGDAPRAPGPQISTPYGSVAASRSNIHRVNTLSQTTYQPARPGAAIPTRSLAAPTYTPGASTRSTAPASNAAYWLVPPG